jgi:hypothetical protein
LNRRRFLAAALALPILRRRAKLASAKTAVRCRRRKDSHQKIATTYNNYYEFGTGKDEPSKNAPLWQPPHRGPSASKVKWRSPRLWTSIRFSNSRRSRNASTGIVA